MACRRVSHGAQSEGEMRSRLWAFSFASTPGRHVSSAGFEAFRAHFAMRASLACTARHLAASRSVASRVAWRRLPRLGTPARASLRASSAASSAPECEGRKTLYLIRHGRTEMNEYLAKHRWDDARFEDPMLFDTRLTALGEAQAVALRAITDALHPEPQLLVASPLRRAMRTADLAFGLERYASTPRVACVHARERVFHASDVGRPAGEVQRDFPEWCVNEMRAEFGDENAWWYVPSSEEETSDADVMRGGRSSDVIPEPRDGPVLRSGVPSEPSEVFEARMRDLKAWLENRPESHIAIVAHWGVWFSLTGREFENCELVTLDVDDLEPGKGKMPV